MLSLFRSFLKAIGIVKDSSGVTIKSDVTVEGRVFQSTPPDLTNSGAQYCFTRKIKTLQPHPDGVTYNEILSSTKFPGSSTMCMGYTRGFNAGFGGTAEIPGIPALFDLDEFHYSPERDFIQEEWHKIVVDANNKQHRLLSVNARREHPEEWYGYWKVNRMTWLDPTNDMAFADIFRDRGVGANLRLRGSVTGKGANLYVNSEQSAVHVSNIGMIDPHMYILTDTPGSFVHVNYLHFKPSGNPAVKICGIDAQGFLTELKLEGLKLENGVLSVIRE